MKQSARAWFENFSQIVEKIGMKKSKFEYSFFYKQSVVVYVYNIVITGSDASGISSLESFLHSQFHTKDLGMLMYFLGVEVIRKKT